MRRCGQIISKLLSSCIVFSAYLHRLHQTMPLGAAAGPVATVGPMHGESRPAAGHVDAADLRGHMDRFSQLFDGQLCMLLATLRRHMAGTRGPVRRARRSWCASADGAVAAPGRRAEGEHMANLIVRLDFNGYYAARMRAAGTAPA